MGKFSTVIAVPKKNSNCTYSKRIVYTQIFSHKKVSAITDKKLKPPKLLQKFLLRIQIKLVQLQIKIRKVKGQKKILSNNTDILCANTDIIK